MTKKEVIELQRLLKDIQKKDRQSELRIQQTLERINRINKEIWNAL
jgi:predicted  nucleic acid-binding Zn-ribbon protein